MHYIVLGYDGKDEKALERRMAVREDHLSIVKEMFDKGKWLYASGILNDDGKPIGSMIICDFGSEEALKKEWLDKEPYVLGNVWERIEINLAEIPSFLVNRK